MLPFAIVFISTMCGMLGAQLLYGCAAGLVLGLFAINQRRLDLSENNAGAALALSLAAMASLMLAQGTSIGAFAAGRLIGRLLLG